jgi:PAS domain S-box-containing protein
MNKSANDGGNGSPALSSRRAGVAAPAGARGADCVESKGQLRRRPEEGEQTLEAIRTGDRDVPFTRAANGEPLGATVTARNITQRRKAEQQLRDAHENLQVHAEQLRTVNDMLQAQQQDLERANENLRSQEQELRERAEAFHESEERYRTLFEAAPDAIVVHREGRFLLANDAALRLTGMRDFQQLAGHTVLDFFRPQDRPRTRQRMRLAAAGRRLPVREAVLRRPDGRELTVEFHTAPVAFRGQPAVQTIIHDITERTRAQDSIAAAQAAVQRERDILQAVMNGAGNSHLVYLDRDFNFVRVNETYARACGYRPEEMIGKNHFALYPHPENEAIFARVRDTGEAFEAHDRPFEFPDQPERGLTYWDWTLIPVRDSGGRVEGLVLSLYETTERKNVEEALRQSEARYRTVGETIPYGVWRTDAAGCCTYVSDTFLELVGMTLEQVQQLGWLHLLPPETVEPTRAHWLRCVATGEDFEREHRFRTKQGHWCHVLAIGRPLRNEQGHIASWVGINLDITARKQAEEALKWSARRDDVLSQTAARLLESDDPQGLIDELCRQAMDLLDCQAFFNFLVDPPSGRLRLNACAGISDEEARNIEWLDYGVAVCGCVARDGLRIVAEDIQNTADPRTTLVKSYGIQAYCCHPLKVQGRVMGTLSFGARSRSQFDPAQVEVMRTVADLVAMAMHRIDIEKTLREWNATLESRVAQRTAELERRTRQLQKLTVELARAQDRERRRVAAILHEDLQQRMAGAKFQVNLLGNQVRDDPSQQVTAAAIDRILKSAIGMSRRLSHELSPSLFFGNDLAEALDRLAEHAGATQALTVRVEVRGERTLQSDALTAFLFRAVDELLRNVARHAGVREATVRVRRVGRYVGLAVSDRGDGFDPHELDETAGFGLLGIRERIELLGGRVRIDSAKGRGTRVLIIVPDVPDGPEERDDQL